MRRDLGTTLLLYTALGAVVCAPIPEFESGLSPDKIEPVLPVLERVLHRSPRQVQPPNPNREQVINNIFQIPISTLTAVSSLLQSTRPITQRPLFPLNFNNQVQAPASASASLLQLAGQGGHGGHGGFHRRQTIGARVAQVTVARDGSSFKI